MGMADEDDLDVLVLEAELIDTLLDQRDVLLVVRIDQDIAQWRVDQVHGQVGRADVVDVAGDPERGKFPVPVGIALREQRRAGAKEEDEKENDERRAYLHGIS